MLLNNGSFLCVQMKSSVSPDQQTRNKKFFWAEEFSWNLGTSISNHLQREKERTRKEKYLVFSPGNS